MDAEELRDLSETINVTLLDATVEAFYATGSTNEQRASADKILQYLKDNPDTWLQGIHILQNAKSMRTVYFALEVLEGVIKYRWNALTVEQRDEIRNCISNVIVDQLPKDEKSFREAWPYVNKFNLILVQVVKHDWPEKWRSFIPHLVEAAKTSDTICENCMNILKLLSEEVFVNSREEMTQQKIKELKASLNSEFELIHEFFLNVLSTSHREELIRATLSALHAYLPWIRLDYIFESSLLETLLKLFPDPVYKILSLQCLSEVAARNVGDCYNVPIVNMYYTFMDHLQAILPLNVNISEAYSTGSSEEQDFILNLALFFTSFFKLHIKVLESEPEDISLLFMGLEYLISISYVDDTQVFKVCLDYWNSLVLELYDAALDLTLLGLQMIYLPWTERSKLYADPVSKLRGLMISSMTEPEENGNIVRETLIYLSLLDPRDTKRLILSKLKSLLRNEEWTCNNLNTLCWSIGSISGLMAEAKREEEFLVKVIDDLYKLPIGVNKKDKRVVHESNIMYVVRHYPRFLRANWKFLKTTVRKLFEFMHETHPGVQDMACDTFLKIVQNCEREFLIVQVGESKPFVSKILSNLATIIKDLEPHQMHTFYESVGIMIRAESDPQKREKYLQRLMALPNQKWEAIMGRAPQSKSTFQKLATLIGRARPSANILDLKYPDVICSVLNVLQTNTHVATSLGKYFLSQMSLIFTDVLELYRTYCEFVSSSIANDGPDALRTPLVELSRSVKMEILKLIETFLDKAKNQPDIGKKFVSEMMYQVFDDYAINVPDARESQVLSLFAKIINKYKVVMQDEVGRIFQSVFWCTLEMINKNFDYYPEHRFKFFTLLRAIATFRFSALIQYLSSEQLELVMDSVIWAFKHTETNIAETGLYILLEMLKNFQKSDSCNQFYRTYFIRIEREIFAVLTDSVHKSGFKLHVSVLQHLFCLVGTCSLTEPLWDHLQDNASFVREHRIEHLRSLFPNMISTEAIKIVDGLYESRSDLDRFKNNISDLLVQSKAFSAQPLRITKNYQLEL